MTELNRATIERLAESRNGTHVSIYMPTERAGDQTQQNRIRFKNQLQAAEESLFGSGLSKTQVADQLQPTHQLLTDDDFWQNQREGLALLLREDRLEFHRLPDEVPAISVVGSRFHLKPLLRYATGQVRYYVLALEREGIRLYRGGRRGVEQVPLAGAPARLSEFLQWDDPESQLQWHTETGRLDVQVGGRGSMFHGHGAGAEGEIQTEDLLRFLRALDRAVYDLLAGDHQPPLVLLGGPELVGHYGKINSYPALADEVISSPSRAGPERVHELAWPAVAPHFDRQLADMERELAELDEGLRVTALEEVLLSAHDGRLGRLLVAFDEYAWGTFDPDSRQVTLSPERVPGDEDLLDRAAVEALQRQTDVLLAEADRIPGSTGVAGILRYSAA